MLTVKGSGCVALGHPASLLGVKSAWNGSPRKMTGAGRARLSNRSSAMVAKTPGADDGASNVDVLEG
jgi:hypothetical protein